jgi:chemotaxis protein CheX
MTAVLALQERLDFGAVAALKSAVEDQIGNDLDIDASAVEHMGTLCLQVLLAAAQDWAKSGHKFQMTNVSDTCLTQLSLHGFTPETITGVAST